MIPITIVQHVNASCTAPVTATQPAAFQTQMITYTIQHLDGGRMLRQPMKADLLSGRVSREAQAWEILTDSQSAETVS